MNIAGNWYFIAALLAIYLPVIWYVTDKVIEPQLGKWVPGEAHKASFGDEAQPLDRREKKGLQHATLAILGVPPLGGYDFTRALPYWMMAPELKGKPGMSRRPRFSNPWSAGSCSSSLASGWAYGAAAGTIKSGDDLAAIMTEAMKDMGYYLVLAFAAAHFVAMFSWSNLGLITAVYGAGAIKSSGLPLTVALGLIVLFAALLNLFVGSAGAKWALLAPVLVPMLMLLGISPEGATAAYRVGDSATNISSPADGVLPTHPDLCPALAGRLWHRIPDRDDDPYSIWMLVSGVALVILWMALGLPLESEPPWG